MDQNEFWSKVDKSGDCWVWTGTQRAGYGIVFFQEGSRKTTKGAHRLSFEWDTGIDPTGQFVRHTCDTPLCVRPDHLVLGNHKQNMADMYERDRANRLLDNEMVSRMREMAARGENLGQLEFSRTVIYNAVTGKSWEHVTTPPVQEFVFERPRKVNKLSHQDVREILDALKTPYHGISNHLAKKYGVKHSMISQIRTGRFIPANFNPK